MAILVYLPSTYKKGMPLFIKNEKDYLWFNGQILISSEEWWMKNTISMDQHFHQNCYTGVQKCQLIFVFFFQKISIDLDGTWHCWYYVNIFSREQTECYRDVVSCNKKYVNKTV